MIERPSTATETVARVFLRSMSATDYAGYTREEWTTAVAEALKGGWAGDVTAEAVLDAIDALVGSVSDEDQHGKG